MLCSGLYRSRTLETAGHETHEIDIYSKRLLPVEEAILTTQEETCQLKPMWEG